MKPINIYLIIYFITMSLPVIGQHADALFSVLEKGNLPSKEKLKIYDDLCWEYMSADHKKSISYGIDGLSLSRKLKDKNYELIFLRNIGVTYFMADAYTDAEVYLDSALTLAEKEKNEVMTAKVYIAQANLYMQISKYNLAIDTYLKALAICDKHNMELEIGKIYSNIGGAYQRLDNNDRALIYLQKSREIAIRLDDNHSIGFLDMAMSNSYMETKPLKALELANNALQIFREHNNVFGETMATLTIADSYYKDKKFEKALSYGNEGHKMAKDSGFPKLEIEALLTLSNIYFQKGEYAEALLYAEEGLAKDTTTSHLVENFLINGLKSNIFLSKTSQATQYVDKYREHMKKFSNENFQRSMSEMEVIYETDKKEMRIQALEKEKILYIAIILLSVIVGIFFIQYIYHRQKLLRQKEILVSEKLKSIEREKELIITQAALEGETAERTRLARDLHDGLGSMLSVVKFSIPHIDNGAVMAQEEVSKFNRAIQLLDDSIQELRRIAHHLMPESLIRLGLKDSLSDFCRTNDKIRFHYFGDDLRLEPKLEILIYRAIHELVTNALKHADASEINVQLVQEIDRISIVVQDNGKGFDPSSVQGSSMGLKNLQHRVETFKGNMDIHSSDQGTEIQLNFDIKTSFTS